jgi:branched-chain amino acid transport system permease protein
VPAEIYLNVAVNGLLTGLVYGLMALGLSVIFGVVRVVNFAHGEMMTLTRPSPPSLRWGSTPS